MDNNNYYNNNQYVPPSTPDRPIRRPETVPPLEPRDNAIDPEVLANLVNLISFPDYLNLAADATPLEMDLEEENSFQIDEVPVNLADAFDADAADPESEDENELLMQLDNMDFDDNDQNNSRSRNFSQ